MELLGTDTAREGQSTGTKTCASYHIARYKRKMHWTGTDGGSSS